MRCGSLVRAAPQMYLLTSNCQALHRVPTPHLAMGEALLQGVQQTQQEWTAFQLTLAQTLQQMQASKMLPLQANQAIQGQQAAWRAALCEALPGALKAATLAALQRGVRRVDARVDAMLAGHPGGDLQQRLAQLRAQLAAHGLCTHQGAGTPAWAQGPRPGRLLGLYFRLSPLKRRDDPQVHPALPALKQASAAFGERFVTGVERTDDAAPARTRQRTRPNPPRAADPPPATRLILGPTSLAGTQFCTRLAPARSRWQGLI
jgi:hypothetical protein